MIRVLLVEDDAMIREMTRIFLESQKRIEHDLYYIENWTLGFDFKIMFLTVFKGFINKNAY